MFLRNVCIYLQVHMAFCPEDQRRQQVAFHVLHIQLLFLKIQNIVDFNLTSFNSQWRSNILQSFSTKFSDIAVPSNGKALSYSLSSLNVNPPGPAYKVPRVSGRTGVTHALLRNASAFSESSHFKNRKHHHTAAT
jgi:hypothetical protein